MGFGPHAADSVRADLSRKHRARSIPPKTDCLMAHIDFAFVQQIFDISKRKWKTDVQHHCQADDFRRCLEVTKGVWFSHDPTLENRPARLKPFYSENTLILHARLAELSQPRKGFACRATGLVLGTKR